MDTGQILVIALSVFMGVWYVAASYFNRRRGVATYYWLRSALESVGKVSEASWIGGSGSGARLVVGKAAAPFRRVEVIFLLESREILPLWLFNRVRKKKDEMIFKASLRTAPLLELEVVRGTGKRPRSGDGRPVGPGAGRPGLPQGFVLHQRGRPDEARVDKLGEFVHRYSSAIKRISVQRGIPHLILQVELPPLMDAGGEAFFSALRRVVAPDEAD